VTPGWKHPAPEGWEDLVWDALAEDLGPGDVSAIVLDPDQTVDWVIEAQAEGVLCGSGIAAHLLLPDVDDPEDCWCEAVRSDGAAVRPGDPVVEGRSLVTNVLARERTALNYVMLLSGVATLTSRFVRQLEGLPTVVCDTRKTVPGLRALQKYAVRCGGGRNHRLGLYDGVMVKDNHIAACGSITEAVGRARAGSGHMTRIEVECADLAQVEEAVRAGADVVMLDNMDPFTMAEAVRAVQGRAITEASGGITLDTVRAVAQTGVDVVSVGALTHSAPALPFHLELR
jgi:nicotinate-nucleotide pyrophosphorylase (carboxylating)